MIEGIDYCFIYPKDDSKSVHIRLLTGKYTGTVFKFGNVKFDPRGEEMYLLFAYDVLESPVAKPKVLDKDYEFKDYIGDLLVELMCANFEQEQIDDNDTEEDIKHPDL